MKNNNIKNKKSENECKEYRQVNMSIKSEDLKTDVVKVVPNYTTKCSNDKEILRLVTVIVSYYDILSEKKIGIVKAEAYICRICKSIYFTVMQYNELKGTLNNKKIKVIEGNKKDCTVRFEIISKTVSTSIKNEILKVEDGEKTISIADLTKLGYSTKKSRDFRREILYQEVIPQFGINNTINIMERLINQYSNRKDYKITVDQWKYDLNELKKKYL